MDEGLYFVPILASTLQESQRQRSLEQALRRIKALGAQERYAEGMVKFEHFMDVAHAHRNAVVAGVVRRLIIELATGTFGETEAERNAALGLINSDPQWRSDYDLACTCAVSGDQADDVPALELVREHASVGIAVFETVPGLASFDGIRPGYHRLRLVKTGWTIWAGQVTAQDVIRTEAHGARSLDLAAQTGDASPQPTREIVLWDGGVVLRMYAGIESGTIDVELCG